MTAHTPRVGDLDGPIAAPEHHRVLFENERVRVVETVIRSGDTAPLHTHLAPHLSIVSSGTGLIRRGADGTVLLEIDPSTSGQGLPRFSWSDGLPAHTLENTGADDIVATTIELKS